MKRHYTLRLLAIVILFFVTLAVNIPEKRIRFSVGSFTVDRQIKTPDIDVNIFGWKLSRVLEFKQGLDLQGGTHLVYEADMSKIQPGLEQSAVDSAREVIARRVNLYGVSEPLIQTSRAGQAYRIIVELPGISDVDQAKQLISATAQLEFLELKEGVDLNTVGALIADKSNWQDSQVNGGDLKGAQVAFNSTSAGGLTQEPIVQLQFTSEGHDKFAQVLKRNVDKPVAIFLDDQLVSMPRVDASAANGLTGDPFISGGFDVAEAKLLSTQINAGALPVPIHIVEQRNVGATLGQSSIQRSLYAGVFGLLIVVLFMFFIYGRLGLIADMALIIYGLLTLTLYKFIPVTLTLAGAAGFILSMGMAVDANILIFESIKEERSKGRVEKIAVERGFSRAWTSIRDANFCTLLVSFILFNPFGWSFLNTSGMIRGFALTLALGIFVSLFTAITVTRTFLRTFLRV